MLVSGSDLSERSLCKVFISVCQSFSRITQKLLNRFFIKTCVSKCEGAMRVKEEPVILLEWIQLKEWNFFNVAR